MEPPSQFKPAPKFVGVFAIMIGVGIIGMTRLHPERVRTDLWLGWAVGAVFALTGAAILFAPPPGTPPEKTGPLQPVLAASIFTLFTAIMAWWAFLAKGATRMSLGRVSFMLRGARFSATGAGPAAVHGAVAAGPDGTSFGGDSDWLDYALPTAARLDGGGALELEARAEPRRAPARSPAVMLAAAGPFVIDSYPGRDSWIVHATAGDCSVNSDELAYGRWTKIALAYDAWSGLAVLFVDGRREAQVACLGPLPSARGDTLRLGTWHEEYQAFTGSLRLVRIYPRAGSL